MQQNVKTRLRARWVCSSSFKNWGHGGLVVLRLEAMEVSRIGLRGAADFGVRRGLLPPS